MDIIENGPKSQYEEKSQSGQECGQRLIRIHNMQQNHKTYRNHKMYRNHKKYINLKMYIPT